MIVELGGQCRELVVVNDHSKAFGRVLTDERLDDGERFTRTWRTYNPSASEWIHDVHPSLAELTLIVVAHRDIHAILVVLSLLALLKRFVFKVESVFQKSFLQEL